MKYELIITEKPAAAKKIADALADGKAIKKNEKGVPYYDITHNKKDIIVASAVGHLYTVAEKEKGKWVYPVFDVKWEASSKVSKGSAFTSKYLSTIKKLAKDADSFTVATDYDIEGEVIGLNVIKYACKQKDAKRMKFSTLTKDEIVNSYEHASSSLDWGQANAGVTRHELDWYYGINLSRALTAAVKTTGGFKLLSSGRVQGPALKIIVDKEKEIDAFKPEPYWQIELTGKAKEKHITALHEKDKFWDKKESEEVMNKVNGAKEGKVADVSARRFNQAPPHPFDLTTLQTEAYRSMGIDPRQTLELAQSLYIKGMISYPRTSSQELPKTIGYAAILDKLKKQTAYKELAEKLLTKPKDKLLPNNGKKKDPAHPAIYPTGLTSTIPERETKLYDIIVRRFMATFGDPATRETVKINIDVNTEIFIAKGTRTVEKGWFEFYGRHVKLEEEELPAVVKEDIVPIEKIDHQEKETKPPKRYTPASIIKELEKRNLGTKATRASIVEALYNRGYVLDKSIQATEIGIRTCEILEKYSPRILDEELTKQFEEEMEKIREKKKKPEEVLESAKTILTKILSDFKKNEKHIGKELMDATKEARDEASYLGKCPNCEDGEIHLRRGKFGRFGACDKYPECKTTYSLPKAGVVKSARKECPDCKAPIITIKRPRSSPQEVCINPDCPSKKITDKEEVKEVTEDLKDPCPKCGSELVLRQSLYGKFIGCSKYPKCRYIKTIEAEKEKRDKEKEDRKKEKEKDKIKKL
ncbi:DNA topoisomerase I [Nanoarchaeota archaeon]